MNREYREQTRIHSGDPAIPPPGMEVCSGRVAIKGETYKCELAPPHDGWAHQNREAEAIWM